jgi:hypothetical protein
MGVYHAIDGMRPAEEVSSDILLLLKNEIVESPWAGRVAAD